MLAAGMLGMAVFLIQAGAAELVLRNDRLCRDTRAANWAFNPHGCQPEAVVFLLRGLAHGVVGALRPEWPPAAGVVTMAVMLGVFAAMMGLMPARRAAVIFIVVECFLAGVFGVIGFLRLYIG
jgi:hypothetical protein